MTYHNTPIYYGNKEINNFIPKEVRDVKVLTIEEYVPDFTNINKRLNQVLESPLGTRSFNELVRTVYSEGKRILFMIDDKTRPNIHTRILLPLLAKRLQEIGVRKEDIGIIISSGSHAIATPKEVEDRILGQPLYETWKDNVLTHNCDQGNRYIGESSLGTPIYINEQVLESCLLIPVSDSEYHYFAGQAGTVKLACPGVAGRETIRINHPRMFDLEKGFIDACRLGNCVGNPVITDIIEITSFVMQHVPIFCIDSIVHQKEIVYLQAGDILECHRVASEHLQRLRVIEVNEPGDLVFVSVGELGVNLYQAGKGIHAAWNALRHDKKGWIILLARCEDGIGSAVYAEAMLSVKDLEVRNALRFVIENYCSEKTFKIGNQKPPDLFRILLDVAEGNIKVVSSLDPGVLCDIYRMEGIKPKSPDEIQQILRDLVNRFMVDHPDPRIYLLNDPGLLVKVKNRL